MLKLNYSYGKFRGQKYNMDFIYTVLSYLVALTRIPFLTVLFITSSIQQVLFERCEVVNIEMKTVPLRCDRQKVSDNVAYIDKLCYENPDLADIIDEDEIGNLDNIDDIDEDEGE